MKAIINNVEVEGTVEEVRELLNFDKPLYEVDANEVIAHEVAKTTDGKNLVKALDVFTKKHSGKGMRKDNPYALFMGKTMKLLWKLHPRWDRKRRFAEMVKLWNKSKKNQ